MALPVGRGFDDPPIRAKWKALTSETPDRSSGWGEGWAASAMLMGAQVQTSDLTSAAMDTNGQFSLLSGSSGLSCSLLLGVLEFWR